MKAIAKYNDNRGDRLQSNIHGFCGFYFSNLFLLVSRAC